MLPSHPGHRIGANFLGRMACFLTAAVAALILPAAPALGGDGLRQALEDGKILLDTRYRFESVDQNGIGRDAQAHTLRVRLGYETAAYRAFAALVEVEHNQILGDDTFNSTANGRTDFPVVADPEDTEINQAYLSYAGVPHVLFRLGRQRLALDNHRFIGNVGWRQLEQTFDAFSATFKPGSRLSVVYAHLNNGNRVFGEHNPSAALAEINLNADILNATFSLPRGKLTAYGYFLELEDMAAASHRNLGLRYGDTVNLGDKVKLGYSAEFADQADYEGGAGSNDARYHRLEAAATFPRVTARLAYEKLGGDGIYGFATPLATLHAHNGWADVFLTTPAPGLQDLSLEVSGMVRGWRLAGIYHDFEADASGAGYGHEVDLLVQRTFLEHYKVSFKYADYRADSFAADVRKVWLMLEMKL